jgi:hypothetical protein
MFLIASDFDTVTCTPRAVYHRKFSLLVMSSSVCLFSSSDVDDSVSRTLSLDIRAKIVVLVDLA